MRPEFVVAIAEILTVLIGLVALINCSIALYKDIKWKKNAERTPYFLPLVNSLRKLRAEGHDGDKLDILLRDPFYQIIVLVFIAPTIFHLTCHILMTFLHQYDYDMDEIELTTPTEEPDILVNLSLSGIMSSGLNSPHPPPIIDPQQQQQEEESRSGLLSPPKKSDDKNSRKRSRSIRSSKRQLMLEELLKIDDKRPEAVSKVKGQNAPPPSIDTLVKPPKRFGDSIISLATSWEEPLNQRLQQLKQKEPVEQQQQQPQKQQSSTIAFANVPTSFSDPDISIVADIKMIPNSDGIDQDMPFFNPRLCKLLLLATIVFESLTAFAASYYQVNGAIQFFDLKLDNENQTEDIGLLMIASCQGEKERGLLSQSLLEKRDSLFVCQDLKAKIWTSIIALLLGISGLLTVIVIYWQFGETLAFRDSSNYAAYRQYQMRQLKLQLQKQMDRDHFPDTQGSFSQFSGSESFDERLTQGVTDRDKDS